MTHSRKAWLTGFTLGAALLVLAPLIWPQSNYMNPSFWVAVMVLTPFAVGALVAATEQSILKMATSFAVGVLSAYAIRVAIDIHHDRTNHNLLPFEFVFDFVGLLVGGLVGGALGALANRSVQPRTR